MLQIHGLIVAKKYFHVEPLIPFVLSLYGGKAVLSTAMLRTVVFCCERSGGEWSRLHLTSEKSVQPHLQDQHFRDYKCSQGMV